MRRRQRARGQGPAAPAGDASVSLTVVGEDTSFDREQLTGPAGEQVTVTFDNRDEGVTHNFHVVAGDEGDFKTDIAAGPVMQTLEFSIATAGEYTYVCDVTPPR